MSPLANQPDLETTSSPRAILLCDLDGTLLNTSLLSQRVYQHLDMHWSLPAGTMELCGQEYKQQLAQTSEFDPAKLCTFLSAQIASQVQVTASNLQDEFFRAVAHYSQEAVYPEVLAALELLCRHGAMLGLFSQGVYNWQLLKFSHCELAKYFTNSSLQFISPDKASDEHLAKIAHIIRTLGLGQLPLWVIDNNLHMMGKLADPAVSVNRIWIDRVTTDTNAEIFTRSGPLALGTHTVNSFAEVWPLIENQMQKTVS